jgi:5'-3' exoribonuclease 2
MGVPAFYRWLSEKYPKIVQDVLEERVALQPGSASVRLPFDATQPNPSGLECDNLYIDMNGIIHPCSHPEVGPQPTCEEEMYHNVGLYVDRLVRVFRPRQLLYLAIDGVAPRAKMNQQRARRFRSAQEARELLQLEEQIRVDDGIAPPRRAAAWDSNVITPGTPFMLHLATYIRFYIRKRISEDRAWRHLRIIFSDASIPGEGEHKIMRHIRLQRAQPGYNPNLVHVLHGLDADLIMLALATHEAHFYIAREEVLFGRQSQEQQEERQNASGFRTAQRALDEKVGPEAMALVENCQKPLQRIAIPILREYLANEFTSCLTPGRIPFAPSLERLIDDIVFMCFFVGNDFLPHLPSLDIRDGALDFLFNVYKRLLPTFGDYITKSGGQVNLSYVDVILAEVGAMEDYVFTMKHENEERERQRREEQKAARNRSQHPAPPPPPAAAPVEESKVMGRAARILAKTMAREGNHHNNPVALSQKGPAPIQATHMKTEENKAAALVLKESLNVVPSIQVPGDEKAPMAGTKRKAPDGEDAPEDEGIVIKSEPASLPPDEKSEFEFDADTDDVDAADDVEEEIIEEVADPEVARLFKERIRREQQNKLDEHVRTIEDKVRLHEPGWKDRYYSDKCKADDVANHGGREHLFRSYVVGLCWVMKYYYDGCPSWKWYYPFHYGPFASDLRNIERFEQDCKSFELNTPFNPVEQLMAVLPSDSSHAIPKESRWLMEDTESPIIDFYPHEVPVDPNGKAMPWLWVVLLPFIDEDRLLAAMSPTMTKWEKSELLCNARGLDDGYLYVHRKNPLTKKLTIVFQDGKTTYTAKVKLSDAAVYGCPGFSGSVRAPLSNEIYPLEEESVVLPPPGADKIDRTGGNLNIFSDRIDPNEAVCVAFTEPAKLSHKSILLPGALVPAPALTDDDKRIRRPKLNRGGGSIAHMGMSNGHSTKHGYGSMNIGSYERSLAQQTGRGNEMNQTGNRPWGAMEPLPKRPHHIPPIPLQVTNPFLTSQGSGQAGSRNSAPQWQNQHQQHGGPRQQNWPNQGPPPPPPYPQHHNQQYHVGYQNGHQQQPYGAPMNQPPPPMHPNNSYQGNVHYGYGNGIPDHRGNRQQNFQIGPTSQNARYGNEPAIPHQHQSFNFRALNQAPGTGYGHPPSHPQNAERRSRASADVVNSLRAQLSSTLNQKRTGDPDNANHPR